MHLVACCLGSCWRDRDLAAGTAAGLADQEDCLLIDFVAGCIARTKSLNK